jgi:hypothetical protein
MYRMKKYFLGLIIAVFIVFLTGSPIGGFDFNNHKVDFAVSDVLNEKESVDVTITIKPESQFVTNSINRKYVMQNLKEYNITYVANSLPAVSATVNREDLNKLMSLPFISNIKIRQRFVLTLQNSTNIVNATTAWPLKSQDLNLTGKDETVCVIDSGVNYSHSGLGSCDRDWFLDGNCTKIIGGYAFYNNVTDDKNDVMGDSNHGTHVAGIVAANGSRKGVAPEAKIVAIKACGPGVSCDENAMIDGINWCVGNASTYNISVISMSIGTEAPNLYDVFCDSSYPGLSSAINSAIEKNISVVISTGNDGNETHISSPGCVQNATPVAATDKSDNAASYNRNNLTLLMAPGTNINSTVLSGSHGPLSGTSMAAPHVSAAIAIMNQYLNLTGRGRKTPSQMESTLNSTGERIDDSAGSGLNYSRIDIYGAIISLDIDNPNVTLVSPGDSSSSLDVNQTFRCNATDLALGNITFYLWNSTDVYNTTSEDVLGASDVFEINLTNLGIDSYKWNCLYTDENNNFDSASSNFSVSVVELNVNLVSPADNLETNQNQTFSCNATTSADTELSNVTFYVWNSTEGLKINVTEDIAGTSNVTNFSYNFTEEGSYIWNCLFVTNTSVKDFSSSNFSVSYDVTNPNITVTLPVNDSWYNAGIFNVSLDENGTCVYSYDLGANNFSMNLSDSSNFSSLNSSISQGEYNITYYCNDTAGNMDSVFRVFNIDSTSPNIGLVSPADAYSVTGTTAINFQYNVTDNLNITRCDLIVDGAVSASNSSEITNGTNTISQTMSVENYTWSINCTDEAGNTGSSSSRSLTVNAEEDDTTSPGGGGTQLTYQTYVPTKGQMTNGYSRELEEEDRIRFYMEKDGEDEQHILTITKIETDSVRVSISSDTITLTLLEDVDNKVNLTSPDYYDLLVRLEEISDSKANITVQTISEDIPETLGIVSNDTNVTTADGLGEEVGEAKIPTKYIILGIIVVAVLAGLGYFLVPHLKKKKKLKGY